MAKVIYNISDETFGKQAKMTLVSVLATVMFLVIGLPMGFIRWSAEQYIWVNALQCILAVAVVLVNSYFDTTLFKDENRKTKIIVKTIIAAVIALAAWIVMTIFDLHNTIVKVILFIVLVAEVITISKDSWDNLKGMFSTLGGTPCDELIDGLSEAKYILKSIHTDKLNSPVGMVVISNYTVIFLVGKEFNGYKAKLRDGTIVNMKKGAFEDKISDFDETTYVYKAEEGIRNVYKITENCGAPAVYTHRVYLSGFDSLTNNNPAVICSSHELNHLLFEMDREYKGKNPNAVANPSAIVKVLVEEFGLVQEVNIDKKNK